MTSFLEKFLGWEWANKSASPLRIVISTRSCEHVCMNDLIALFCWFACH